VSGVERKLLQRKLTRVGVHVASFVVVGTILGWPWQVMGFWAVGLVVYLGKTVYDLVGPPRGGRSASDPPVTVPTAETASHATDPYLRDLERSIEALRRAAAEAGAACMDLDAVADAARTLHRRRQRLGELVDPGLRRRLDGELEQARERAAGASDERAAEVYEAEAQAIASRLEAMDDASTVAERLRARERTILHEIDAARLALARSGISDEPTASLGRHLDKLRADLAAETEVEERLAQARRTQRARET